MFVRGGGLDKDECNAEPLTSNSATRRNCNERWLSSPSYGHCPSTERIQSLAPSASPSPSFPVSFAVILILRARQLIDAWIPSTLATLVVSVHWLWVLSSLFGGQIMTLGSQETVTTVVQLKPHAQGI